MPAKTLCFSHLFSSSAAQHALPMSHIEKEKCITEKSICMIPDRCSTAVRDKEEPAQAVVSKTVSDFSVDIIKKKKKLTSQL